MTDEIRIDSELAYAEFLRDLRKDWLENRYLLVRVRKGRQRTLTQNAALHLWLGMVAYELNAAGFDMKRTLKQGVEIPWTMESAKEHLWRPIQQAMLNKESTTEADRKDYSYVCEVLTAHVAQKFGVQLPEWPCKDFRNKGAA